MTNNQKTGISFAQATVLVAVIAVIGDIVTVPLSKHVQRYFEKEPTLESEVDPDRSTKETVPSKVKKAKLLKANTVYKAESSGFVSVYSFGPESTHGWIRSGPDQGKLDERTRFNKWGGATLWVREGEYWITRTEHADRVSVQWIPFF